MKYQILVLLLMTGFFTHANQTVPGEFIVKAPEGMQLNTFQSLLTQDSSYVKIIDNEKGYFLIRRPAIEREGFGTLNAQAILPVGTKIEPNVMFSIHDIPKDEFTSLQFNLYGRLQVDQKDCQGQTLSVVKSIGMQSVDLSQLPNESVRVAVVDTGVDLNHLDLQQSIFVNEAEAFGQAGVDDDNNGYIDDIHGYNFVNNTANGTDDNGHGTHVAGIISATSNNQVGISGVSSVAKILPVKFLDAQGSGTLAGALEALTYADKMQAQIINASFGGATDSPALKEKIDDLEEKGIIIVAAAGNSSRNIDLNPTYPASYFNSNVVTVASTNADGSLSRFSNHSSNLVDISAPGTNILSTFKGGGYECLSGTSMATPHVAGALSLALSKYPDLDHRQIIQLLQDSAESTEDLKAFVHDGSFLRVDQLLQ